MNNSRSCSYGQRTVFAASHGAAISVLRGHADAAVAAFRDHADCGRTGRARSGADEPGGSRHQLTFLKGELSEEDVH